MMALSWLIHMVRESEGPGKERDEVCVCAEEDITSTCDGYCSFSGVW